VLHPHNITLRQIPKGDRVFFAIRDPIDRFVSGFYSRQRQGKPRINSPWTPAEAEAFGHFGTVDSLGRALTSTDLEERAAARTAMESISHVRVSYWNWFGNMRTFARRLDDLLLILWVPELTTSFACLCDLLGLPDEPFLPDDDVLAHRNPAGVDRTLSVEARANLEAWYAQDRAFVAMCSQLPCFAPNLDQRPA
jgi:hypothetical protein